MVSVAMADVCVNSVGSGGTIHGVVMMVSAAVAEVCVDSVYGGGWWVDGS